MWLFFILFIALVIFIWICIGIIADKNEIDNNDNGDYIDSDIAIVVLQNLQMSLSKSERKAIDYAIECIKACEKIEEWINENER